MGLLPMPLNPFVNRFTKSASCGRYALAVHVIVGLSRIAWNNRAQSTAILRTTGM
jgi:hypothetical protein